MRKCAVIAPLLALVSGIAGFFLRSHELKTVFDDGLGLAVPNAPVTVCLISLSAVVFAAAIICALFTGKKFAASPDANRAFAPGSRAVPMIDLVLGLVVIVGMALVSLDIGFSALSLFDLVFILFGILTGVLIIASAFAVFKGTPAGSGLCVLSIVPPLFFCVWLIMIYKEHSSDPVTLHFAYACLAAAAAALSYFYTAGFFFRKSVTGRTIICQIMAIYLLTVTLADHLGTALTIAVSAFIVHQFISCFLFIRNLCPKTDSSSGKAASETA